MVLALISTSESQRPTPRPRNYAVSPIGWSRLASRTISPRAGRIAALQSHEAVKKIFDEIAPRFKDRNGGYTRVIKLGLAAATRR